MSRFIIRRRADGVVVVRRRTLRHLLGERLAGLAFVLFVATATLAAVTTLVAGLIQFPSVGVLIASAAALGLLARGLSRSAALQPAPAPIEPRPPRRVA